MIEKEMMWRTARNTVYWFNLKGRGVLFYDTMQVESSVSVVKMNKDDSPSEILFIVFF